MIITIAGLAGAGKSTLAKHISAHIPNTLHLDLDKINTKLLNESFVKDFARELFSNKVFDNDQIVKSKISHLIYSDANLYLKWCEFMKFTVENHIEQVIQKDPKKIYLIDHLLVNELKLFHKSVMNIMVQLPEPVRLERVAKRDNLPINKIKQREKFLKPYNECDFDVVYIEGESKDIIPTVQNIVNMYQ